MEDVNFCREVNNILNVKELDSKTLTYRINGFLLASSMNLDNGIYKYIVNNNHFHFATKKSCNDDYNVSISIMDYDKHNNKRVKLFGDYSDLQFEFINDYNKNVLKNKIIRLPFSITINKDCGKNILKLRTVKDEKVEFYIENNNISNHYRFYANIFDFGIILKTVKSFVDNPSLVYDTYKEVMENKRITFTNTDVKKAISPCERLDEPVSKIMKKIKIYD